MIVPGPCPGGGVACCGRSLGLCNGPSARLAADINELSSWAVRNSRTASVETAPMPMHTIASRARIPAMRRPRSEVPARRRRALRNRLENRAGHSQRVDHRIAAGIDLLANVRDVQLHDVRLPTEVVVPDPIQDLHLRQHPPGIAHQVAKKFELRRGQRDR